MYSVFISVLCSSPVEGLLICCFVFVVCVCVCVCFSFPGPEALLASRRIRGVSLRDSPNLCSSVSLYRKCSFVQFFLHEIRNFGRLPVVIGVGRKAGPPLLSGLRDLC